MHGQQRRQCAEERCASCNDSGASASEFVFLFITPTLYRPPAQTILMPSGASQGQSAESGRGVEGSCRRRLRALLDGPCKGFAAASGARSQPPPGEFKILKGTFSWQGRGTPRQHEQRCVAMDSARLRTTPRSRAFYGPPHCKGGRGQRLALLIVRGGGGLSARCGQACRRGPLHLGPLAPRLCKS